MTIDTVLSDIAPEFDSVASDKRARFIEYATAEVDFGNGTIKEQAIAYLAAHKLSMASRVGGAAGQVTSEKEGSLSRSYGSVSGQTGYNQTSYGQEFIRLRDGNVVGFLTRAGV